MTSLVLLLWTAVTCLCWTSGSAQAPNEGARYPPLLSTVHLTCECHLEPCESVLWFRSLEDGGRLQFLMSVNSADRPFPSPELDTSRFRASVKSSKLWSLRIEGLTGNDTGLYSCVLRNTKTVDLWLPGVLLLPGVTPPTAKPTPKEVVCGCRGKSQRPQPQGCGSFVLWPMVGILAALVVALLSTLHYFSRLPKKCRHHFVKKGQMRRT